MKLKQLTLQGYKTFPTKTEFIFDEGITAIVGPNGSGKSNIADALRWVLGEQSYSTLRGKRTIDMIFQGSESRSRSGMAQATLSLDNADGWLPIDYSEVEITRRAFRSGENEYILNGQKVRLRDITELLAKSGLSERTYTIIGQGLIDQALSLKADERRALFEEAAGINHYKSRRAETLRRLNDTQHNLERVQDILAEIKPRMNSLKRQALRAKNFEQINKDLRHLLRIWYGYKWDQSRKELRLAKSTALEAEKKWQESRKKILIQQQSIDQLQTDITKGQQSIAKLHEQREIIRDRLEAARRQFAIQEERKDVISKQLNEIEVDLPVFEEQRGKAAAELSAATADLSAAQDQLAQNNLNLEQFQTSFNEKRIEINNWQSQIKNAESRLTKIQNNLAQSQGKLSQLKERLQENIKEKENNDPENINKLSNLASQLENEWSQKNEELVVIRKNRQKLQSLKNNLTAELKNLRKQADDKQKAFNKVKDLTARLETKVDLLDQLRTEKFQIDSSHSIIGTFVSLISIPDKYKVSIESALSERLEALIVPDNTSLWELIEQSNGQKVSVASLENIPDQDTHPSPKVNGVIGWAVEKVEWKDSYKKIVSFLLGSILLVEDRKVAYEVSQALPAGTMAVSKDGFVVYAGGLVQTGEQSNEDSILAREEAWKKTKVKLETIRQEYEILEQATVEKNREIQYILQQIDEAQNEDQNLSKEENNTVKVQASVQRKIDQNKQQLSFLKRQEESRNQEIEKLEFRIKEVKTRISEEKSNLQNARQALSNAQLELDKLPLAESKQQQENLEQAINTSKTIVAGRLAVVDSRRTTLNQVDGQLNRLNQRRQSFINQLKLLSTEDHTKDHKNFQNQQIKIDQEIEPILLQVNSKREKLFELQRNTAGLQKQAHEVETVYTQTQVKLTQKQSQMEGLRERIHADLGLVALRMDEDQTGPVPLPMSNVFDLLPDVSELPEDIEQTIQQYRGQLQRIGGINPDAPVEYEETISRFEFMTQQVEDLQETEQKLRQVISELDDLTSKAFAETVEKVNSIFGETFTQLFGGGSARLALTDPDDLTVSGVDIIARLPNRREQGLGLLSGGERSLTASALIFSLLKVSPTPFCVLDEVDAALDEANINRFRIILRELSLKTQIIVITHNRGTVEAAQTIYGVSMQPDSASQVISIRPEEYIRQELV